MLYMLFPINSPPGFNDQLPIVLMILNNGLLQIIFYVMPPK